MTGKKHSIWWSYGMSSAIVLVTLIVVALFAKDRVYNFFVNYMQDELKSKAGFL